MLSTRTSMFIAAAISTGVLGLPAVPVVSAAPMTPLTPPPADCLQFGFPGGGVTIKISNGNQVVFSPPRGQNFQGVPSVVEPVNLAGTMSGTVNGRSVNLTNTTNRGPFAYNGTVGPDGIARGNLDGGSWQTQYRLTCLERPAPPPAPAPVPVPEPEPAPAPTAVVTGDVDVYDVPGGVGSVIGMLDGGEGQTVPFVSCKADNWCQIGFAAGPGGRAWVWGDFLSR